MVVSLGMGVGLRHYFKLHMTHSPVFEAATDNFAFGRVVGFGAGVGGLEWCHG